MKVIFSTAYDSRVYKNNTQNGAKYIGSKGLLNILERELGIYSNWLSLPDRISLYLEAIEDTREESFYTEVFKADKMAVAEELLSYRDELVFARYDFNNTSPYRFSDLKEVEEKFLKYPNHQGESDRWITVITQLEKFDVSLLKFSKIIVEDDISLLHPTFQYLFQLLKDKIVIAEYDNTISQSNNLGKVLDMWWKQIKGDRSKVDQLDDDLNTDFIIYEFNSKQLMNDTAAMMLEKGNHLLVQNKRTDIDNSLVSIGKQAVGSDQFEGIPQSCYLWKLLKPQFSGKVRIKSLLELIQLSISPVPYKLRPKLIKQLKDKPGIGNEDWNKKILGYLNNIDDQDEIKRQGKLFELLFLEKEIKIEDEQLSYNKKLIKSVLDYLRTELKKVKLPSEEAILRYLIDIGDNLYEKVKANYNSEQLVQYINLLTESKPFINYHKQIDSADTADNMATIASDCNLDVLCLDFQDWSFKFNEQSFLLAEEKELLLNEGKYYSKTLQYQLGLFQYLRGLKRLKRNLLLFVLEDDRELADLNLILHSNYSNIRSQSNVFRSIKDIKHVYEHGLLTKESDDFYYNKIEVLNSKLYYQLPILKELNKPKKESYSSIDNILSYPFDWVLKYYADVKALTDDSLKIPTESILKGNVSHRIIELLFKDKVRQSYEYSAYEFEDVFDHVINTEASDFLLPEYKIECMDLKAKLTDAVKSLAYLMKQYDCFIESCELEVGEDQGIYLDRLQTNFGGFIDLVLKTKSGNLIVIDLKWTTSTKKYANLIKDGDAIQLALYEEVLKEKNVACGYFLINQNRFLTRDECFKSDHVVLKIDSEFDNKDVLDKMEKALKHRWDEFEEGKVEQADELEVENLSFHQLMEGSFTKSDKKGKKYRNGFSGFELFTGKLN
jgi:hypothetical protein